MRWLSIAVILSLGLMTPAAAEETAPAKQPTSQPLNAAAAAPAKGTSCRVRGFVVNDYGKVGPTADAQSMLDKDIASWAKASGIARYKTGPKTVSCEKYLDFGFFDEWTCTARARVCW